MDVEEDERLVPAAQVPIAVLEDLLEDWYDAKMDQR